MVKTSIFTMALLLFSLTLTAQTNFKWDVIIDNLDGDKSELYARTKVFISEAWNSAEDVIQYDDPETGMIVVSGISMQEMYSLLENHTWTFSYTVKFYQKDNKCRLIIEDVDCLSAPAVNNFPVVDAYPTEKGRRKTSLSKKRYLELMAMLKAELQIIVDVYDASLKYPIFDEDEDW